MAQWIRDKIGLLENTLCDSRLLEENGGLYIYNALEIAELDLD